LILSDILVLALFQIMKAIVLISSQFLQVISSCIALNFVAPHGNLLWFIDALTVFASIVIPTQSHLILTPRAYTCILMFPITHAFYN